MKNKIILSIGLITATLMFACNFGVAIPTANPAFAPTDTPISIATAGSQNLPKPTIPVTYIPPTPEPPTPTSIAINGTEISFFGTSFSIPAGLGTGTQNDIQPQTNDPNIPFDIHPAYTRIILQGYPITNKAFEPQVLIYPAKEYAQMGDGAEMIINNLQNDIAAQRTSPAEPLPFLPLINAGQIFHAQEKFINFKNGSGIRFVTEFDQAPLPINNGEILYTFQGLTNDGEYYVAVLMPINLPYLPEDYNPNSPQPPDAIQFNPEDFSTYLNNVIDRLNHVDNSFNPKLDSLDTLVQSIATYGVH